MKGVKETMSLHRVVIQWNEGQEDKWPLMARNVFNLQRALPDAQIRGLFLVRESTPLCEKHRFNYLNLSKYWCAKIR